MLVPLILAVLPVAVQMSQAGNDSASARRAAPIFPVDSQRILRSARRAQERFESVRRENLPREWSGGSHPCDVIIGRWCRWDDGEDERDPPPEAPRIVEARRRFLGTLDSAARLLPGDGWLAAQRVRYLLEDGRAPAAESIGVACRHRPGLAAWCSALAGLAAHVRADYAGADAHFSTALAAMPVAERCEWLDIADLLEDEVARAYARASCDERARIAERVWRIGAPLYLRGAVDFRTEMLARRTALLVEANTRTPFGLARDEGMRELRLRYGGGSWYSREEVPTGSMREPGIVSHGAKGLDFNFMPAAHALVAPATLTPDDWELRLRTSRTRYAPAYARHLAPLAGVQVAFFPRGDSTVVVAAYDVGADTSIGRAPLEAGVFVARIDADSVRLPVGARLDTAARRGVVRTSYPGAAPVIVSVEVLDSARRAAQRTRFARDSVARAGRIRVSDLLLYSPAADAAAPHTLDDVAALAMTSTRLGRTHPLGLFWETYGLVPEGEMVAVALTIERVGVGVVGRLARTLRLAAPDAPLSVHWTETPDPTTRVASRGVTVSLARLHPGRYRVQLAVTAGGAPPARASREVVLLR